MKKLLILAVAFTFSGNAFAQDKIDSKMDHDTTKVQGKIKDCVMMEGGKLVMMKDGSTMAMNHDMQMTNGATVTIGGTVKIKDSSTNTRKDGQCMYLNGKIGTMRMNKMKGGKMDKM